MWYLMYLKNYDTKLNKCVILELEKPKYSVVDFVISIDGYIPFSLCTILSDHSISTHLQITEII